MPFYEIDNSLLKQRDKNLTTRWFKDGDWDLFIWENSEQEIRAFQITLGSNCFVEWIMGKGLRTGTVDDGEGTATMKKTPVVYMTSIVDLEMLGIIRDKFLFRTDGLAEKTKNFIINTLNAKIEEKIEYSNS